MDFWWANRKNPSKDKYTKGENDFFLKEELDKGNYTEHNLIPTNRQELPCFSIETEWEFYELYVCICENGN